MKYFSQEPKYMKTLATQVGEVAASQKNDLNPYNS